MLITLLKTYARIPLPLIHAMGWVCGWVMYLGSSKYRRRIKNNIARTQLATNPAELRQLVRRNIHESGKAALEILVVWFRPEAEVLSLIKECTGWHYVEAAVANKKGIIFLTPHLGCYEITGVYYGSRHPLTVLFRPSRSKLANRLYDEGRGLASARFAPTNMGGVRKLLKALKQGEAIGILPDQVPDANEGVWADFFGRPAYTMTLVTKLAESTGATVLLAFGERLSGGRGYHVHFSPFTQEPTPQNINTAVESLVKQRPEQYLWSYRRYKKP